MLGGYGGNVGDDWDVVNPVTGAYGKDACFASGWLDEINDIIFNFVAETGLSMVETDGPYGGGPCASTNHTYHIDGEDSIYKQTLAQGNMYKRLIELGVFINQPDKYFYQGGNKAPLGYNEAQYSLPRWEDITVSRYVATKNE